MHSLCKYVRIEMRELVSIHEGSLKNLFVKKMWPTREHPELGTGNVFFKVKFERKYIGSKA